MSARKSHRTSSERIIVEKDNSSRKQDDTTRKAVTSKEKKADEENHPPSHYSTMSYFLTRGKTSNPRKPAIPIPSLPVAKTRLLWKTVFGVPNTFSFSISTK